ncbi:titin homolog [Macrobrachium rosenbergii]|uniref:titin homolog n=1 Tax=Macrobrachium rosenbergii TaxID=79674 RepID=UPI0034D56C69
MVGAFVKEIVESTRAVYEEGNVPHLPDISDEEIVKSSEVFVDEVMVAHETTAKDILETDEEEGEDAFIESFVEVPIASTQTIFEEISVTSKASAEEIVELTNVKEGEMTVSPEYFVDVSNIISTDETKVAIESSVGVVELTGIADDEEEFAATHKTLKEVIVAVESITEEVAITSDISSEEIIESTGGAVEEEDVAVTHGAPGEEVTGATVADGIISVPLEKMSDLSLSLSDENEKQSVISVPLEKMPDLSLSSLSYENEKQSVYEFDDATVPPVDETYTHGEGYEEFDEIIVAPEISDKLDSLEGDISLSISPLSVEETSSLDSVIFDVSKASVSVEFSPFEFGTEPKTLVPEVVVESPVDIPLPLQLVENIGFDANVRRKRSVNEYIGSAEKVNPHKEVKDEYYHGMCHPEAFTSSSEEYFHVFKVHFNSTLRFLEFSDVIDYLSKEIGSPGECKEVHIVRNPLLGKPEYQVMVGQSLTSLYDCKVIGMEKVAGDAHSSTSSLSANQPKTAQGTRSIVSKEYVGLSADFGSDISSEIPLGSIVTQGEGIFGSKYLHTGHSVAENADGTHDFKHVVNVVPGLEDDDAVTVSDLKVNAVTVPDLEVNDVTVLDLDISTLNDVDELASQEVDHSSFDLDAGFEYVKSAVFDELDVTSQLDSVENDMELVIDIINNVVTESQVATSYGMQESRSVAVESDFVILPESKHEKQTDEISGILVGFTLEKMAEVLNDAKVLSAFDVTESSDATISQTAMEDFGISTGDCDTEEESLLDFVVREVESIFNILDSETVVTSRPIPGLAAVDGKMQNLKVSCDSQNEELVTRVQEEILDGGDQILPETAEISDASATVIEKDATKSVLQVESEEGKDAAKVMLQVESAESSPVIDSVNDNLEADESREWAEQDGFSVSENTVGEVESVIEEIFSSSKDKDGVTEESHLSQNVEESHITREPGTDIEQQLKSLVENMDVMSSSFVQEMLTIEKKVEEKISLATDSSMVRPEPATEVFEDQLVYVVEGETTSDTDNLVKISPATVAKELEMTVRPENVESLPEIHVESNVSEIPQELLLKLYDVDTDSNVQENDAIKDLELIESISEGILVQELKIVSENITDVEIVQEVDLDEIRIVPEAAFGEGTGIMVGLLEEGIDVIALTKEVKVQNIPEIHEETAFEQSALEIESVISIAEAHAVSDSAAEDASSNTFEELYTLDAISEEVLTKNINIEAEAILPVVSESSVEVLELAEAGVDQVAVAFETVLEEIIESPKDIELMVITPGTSVEKTGVSTGILVDEASVKEMIESPGNVFAEEFIESAEAVEEADLTNKLESFKEMVESAVAVTDEVATITVDSSAEENVEISRAISEELIETTTAPAEDYREEELAIKPISPIEVQVEEVVESTEGITVDIVESLGTLDKEEEMAFISKGFVDELAGEKKVLVKREAPVEITDFADAVIEEDEVVIEVSAKGYMESVEGVIEAVIAPKLQFEEMFDSVEDDIGKVSVITETSTKEDAGSVSASVQKEEVESDSDIFDEGEFAETTIEEVSEMLESFVEEIVESTIDFIEETGIVPEVLVDELVELTGSIVEEVGTLYEEIIEPAEDVIEVAIKAEASADDIVESTRDVFKEEVACVSEFSEEVEELEVVIDIVVESVQGNTEETEIIHEASVGETVESTSSVVKKETASKFEDPIEEMSISSEAVTEDVAITAETPVEGTAESTEAITENISVATEAASVVEIEEFAIKPEPLVEEIADLTITSESSAEEIVGLIGAAVMEISVDSETSHGEVLDSIKDLAIETEESKEVESATAVVEKDIPVSYSLPGEVEVPSAVIDEGTAILEVFDDGIPILPEASIDKFLELTVAAILEEEGTVPFEGPSEEIVAATEEVTITVETSALEILKLPQAQVGEIVEFPQAVTEDIAVTTKASTEEFVIVAETSFEVIVEPTGVVVEELVEVKPAVPIEEIIGLGKLVEDAADQVGASKEEVSESTKAVVEKEEDKITSEVDLTEVVSEEETSEEVIELTKSLIEDLEITAEDSVDTYLESADFAFEDGEGVVKSDALVEEFVLPPEAIIEAVTTTFEATAEEIVESTHVVFEEVAEPSETFSEKVTVAVDSSSEEIVGRIEAFEEEEKVGVTPKTLVEIIASTESIVGEPVESTAIFGQVEDFAFTSKVVGEDFVELTEAVIGGFAIVFETSGEESVEPTKYGFEEFEITPEEFADEPVESPSSVGGVEDSAIKPEAKVESAAVTEDLTISAEASEEMLELTQPIVEAEKVEIMEETVFEAVDKPSEAVYEEVLIITDTSVEVLNELEIAELSESINEEDTFTIETSAEVTIESTESSFEVELDITSEVIDEELVEITEAILDEIAVITEAFVEDTVESANAIGEIKITANSLVEAFMESTDSVVEDEKIGDELEAVVEESVEPLVMVTRDITITSESSAEEILKSAGPVVEEEEVVIKMNAHVEEVIELDETVSEDFTFTVEVSAKEIEESSATVVEEASVSLNVQTEMVVEVSETEIMTENSTEDIVEVETFAIVESPEGILEEAKFITEISAEEVVEPAARNIEEEFVITSEITDEEFFKFTEAIIDEVAIVLDTFVDDIVESTQDVLEDFEMTTETYIEKLVKSSDFIVKDAAIKPEFVVEENVESSETVTEEVAITKSSTDEVVESTGSVAEVDFATVKEASLKEIVVPLENFIEDVAAAVEIFADEVLELTGAAVEDESPVEIVEVYEAVNVIAETSEVFLGEAETTTDKKEAAILPEYIIESTEDVTQELQFTAESSVDEVMESDDSVIEDGETAVKLKASVEEIDRPSEAATEKFAVTSDDFVEEEIETTGGSAEILVFSTEEDKFVIKQEISVEIVELVETVAEEDTVETSEKGLKELVGTVVEKVDDFITPEIFVEVESTGDILEDLGNATKAEEVVGLTVSVVEEKEVTITMDAFGEVVELAEAAVDEVAVMFAAVVGDIVESVEDIEEIGIAPEPLVDVIESVDSVEEDKAAIIVEIVESKEVTVMTEAAVQETEALPLPVIEEMKVAVGVRMENNIKSKQETILEAGIESDVVEEVAITLDTGLKTGESAISVAEEIEILLDVGNVSDSIEEETKIIPGTLSGEIPVDYGEEMEVLGSVLEEGKLASPVVIGEDFETVEDIVTRPEIILEESEIFTYAVKKEIEVLLESLSVDEEIAFATDEEVFDSEIAKEVIREVKAVPEYVVEDSEIVDIVVKEVETTQTLLGDSEIARAVLKEIENPPEVRLGDSDIAFAVVKEIGGTLKSELKEREIVLSVVEEVDSIFDDSDILFDTAVQESGTPKIVVEAATTEEMEMTAEAVFIGNEVALEGMEVTQEYLWEDGEPVPAMDDSMQMGPFNILESVESAFISIMEETGDTPGADLEDVNLAAILEERITPAVFVEVEERTIISVLEADEITRQDVWEGSQITPNAVMDKIEKMLDDFAEIEITPVSVLEYSDIVSGADLEESELELAPEAILKDGEISVDLEEVVLEDIEFVINEDGDIEIPSEAAIDAEVALSAVEETGTILEDLMDSDNIAFDVEEEIKITPEALLEDEIMSSIVEVVGMTSKTLLEEEEYAIGVAEKIEMVSIPELILGDDFVSDALWEAIGIVPEQVETSEIDAVPELEETEITPESLLEIHDTESDDEQIKITPEAILEDDKNTTAIEETEVTPEAILEGVEIASDVAVEEIRFVPESVVELGELAANIVFEKIEIVPKNVLETAEDILYAFEEEIRITTKDLLEEGEKAAEAILKDTVISYSAASGAVEIPVGTVTEEIDITAEVVESPVGTVTKEIDITPVAADIPVGTVTEEIGLTAEVIEGPIGTVAEETDITPEVVELLVETVTEVIDITAEVELPDVIVTEEIDITPVADELPVVIVTEEIDITAEGVEVLIETVTEEFDITPKAAELPVGTVTEEIDITSEAAELPVGTVPEEIYLTPEVVEVSVGTVTEELEIMSEVVEVPIRTVTEEIDITPEAAGIPVGPSIEEIDLTPVADELPVGTVIEEVDIASEVVEASVGTVTEEIDITPVAVELPVGTVTEEIDIKQGVVGVPVGTVKEETDITAEVVEVPVETVTEETDITAVVVEVPVETVTEEIDITAEVVEASIGTVTEETDITAEVVEVPIGTVTEETDITPEVVEVPVETVTEEIDITGEVVEVPIGTVTEETDITPEVVEVPVETVTEEIDITPEVVEVLIGTITEETDMTPEVVGIPVETVTEETDITAEVVEVPIGTVTEETDITPEVVEVPVETVTEEIDITPEVVEVPIGIVTEETDITPVVVEIPVETVTEETDITAEVVEVPVETVTEEIDITPEVAEIPGETVTEEIDITGEVVEVPIGIVTEETDITPEVVEIPVETVTEEIDITPEVVEVPIGIVTEETDMTPEVVEIPVETVAEEIDITPEVAEIPVETVTEEIDITAEVVEAPIGTITEETDITAEVVQVPIGTGTEETDITPEVVEVLGESVTEEIDITVEVAEVPIELLHKKQI